MNCLICMIVKGKSEKVKGLNSTVKHLKTQTNLEIQFEKKDRPTMDFFADVAEDIAALGLEGSPIGAVSVIVGDAGAIGRLHNRSVRAFSRISVITEEIDWDADSGALEFTVENGVAEDLAPLVDVIARLIFRATVKCSHTRHPLTLFDLKQTTGLVQDLKDEVGAATDIISWFDARELIVVEGEKAEAKAIADKKRKAKAEKVKAEKEKEKAKDAKDAKVKDAKAKVGGKTKTKPVEEEEGPN